MGLSTPKLKTIMHPQGWGSGKGERLGERHPSSPRKVHDSSSQLLLSRRYIPLYKMKMVLCILAENCSNTLLEAHICMGGHSHTSDHP
jgi:hypothetical protein